ncbi:MAG: hypothetical protein HDS11_02810 [Bacteroides sp.]|nr:hypothetical protein [Bacteroides sp.]
MIDYRKDIIKLMKATTDSEQSLKQSMIALSIITKIYNDSENKEKSNSNSEEDIGNASKLKETSTIENEEEENENKSPIKEDLKKETPIKNTDINEGEEEKKKAKEELKAKKREEARRKLSKVVLGNQNKKTITKPLPPIPNVKIIKTKSNSSDKYTIRRKLLGSEAIDGKNASIQYFNEHFTRKYNLEEGDTVTLSRTRDFNDNRSLINVKHNHKTDNTGIIEFGPAPIKRDAFGLYVERNSNDEPLSKYNSSKARLMIDLSSQDHFGLNEGDLISIVWYESEPDNIKIRWKYANEPIPSETTQTKSKVTGKKKELLHKKNKQNNTSTKNISSDEYKPRIDFDLGKRRVTIVTGDKSVTSNLEKVVIAHNGIPKIIELKNPSKALRAAKESSYVVLIQSYIKHAISQLLINTKNRNYSIAMATTSGQLAVEKALYRAKNKLKVTDIDNIAYPYTNVEYEDLSEK